MVDVFLELGELWVESLLLRRQFDLERRNIYYGCSEPGLTGTRSVPRLIINSVATHSSGQSGPIDCLPPSPPSTDLLHVLPEGGPGAVGGRGGVSSAGCGVGGAGRGPVAVTGQ